MKILISGAMGYMGRAIAAQAKQEQLEVTCGVDIAPAAADFPVYTSFEEAPQVDVVIDFSKPESLNGLLKYCQTHHTPVVLATTGFDDSQLAQISEASKNIAIFRSGNMSLGIALVRALVRKATQVLGDSFDIEIVEAHHNRKVDAPSGTALMLYEAINEADGEKREAVCGRQGRNAQRKPREIGIHALRGGTVTGEHEVCFFGPSERITISHSAENRSVFAVGALRAAAFLMDKAPGEYNMDDMLAE